MRLMIILRIRWLMRALQFKSVKSYSRYLDWFGKLSLGMSKYWYCHVITNIYKYHDCFGKSSSGRSSKYCHDIVELLSTLTNITAVLENIHLVDHLNIATIMSSYCQFWQISWLFWEKKIHLVDHQVTLLPPWPHGVLRCAWGSRPRDIFWMCLSLTCTGGGLG